MKADVDGTPTEQFRARAGWVSATQAASVAPPGQRCGTCINLGQPADTDRCRAAPPCELMQCVTRRGAWCEGWVAAPPPTPYDARAILRGRQRALMMIPPQMRSEAERTELGHLCAELQQPQGEK